MATYFFPNVNAQLASATSGLTTTSTLVTSAVQWGYFGVNRSDIGGSIQSSGANNLQIGFYNNDTLIHQAATNVQGIFYTNGVTATLPSTVNQQSCNNIRFLYTIAGWGNFTNRFNLPSAILLGAGTVSSNIQFYNQNADDGKGTVQVQAYFNTNINNSSITIPEFVFPTLAYSGNTNTAGSVPTSQTGALTYTIQGQNTLAKSAPFVEYDFAGWNTLANSLGTWYQQGQTITPTVGTTTTLYAMWRPVGGGGGNEALKVLDNGSWKSIASVNLT